MSTNTTTTAMTAVEKSTKALNASVLSLSKVATEIGYMTQMVPDLIEEIQLQQGKLNVLEEEYDEKFRKAKVDLSNKVYENEEKVMTDLMKKRGLVTLSEEALTKLQEDLAFATQGNEDAVTKAVAIAKNQVKAEYEKSALEASSNWKVEKAELEAKAASAQDKIDMLEKQVVALTETITEERKARIEIAQAESNKQATVINTNSK